MYYFVTQDYPIANGIVASSRAKHDLPENIWNTGMYIHDTFGWRAAAFFGFFGKHYVFAKKNVSQIIKYVYDKNEILK